MPKPLRRYDFLTIRATIAEHEAVTAAARIAGRKNRSEWIREVLLKAAAAEVAAVGATDEKK